MRLRQEDPELKADLDDTVRPHLLAERASMVVLSPMEAEAGERTIAKDTVFKKKRNRKDT